MRGVLSSKSTWLIRLAISSVALISFYFYLAKYWQPRFSDERIIVNNSSAVFKDGSQGAQLGKDLVSVCGGITGHFHWFCVEGYYTGLFVTSLTNQGKIKFPTEFKKESMEGIFAAVAAGIATAFFDHDPDDVIQQFQDSKPLLTKYFLDGRGFGLLRRRGFLKAKLECQKIGDPQLVRFCFFGVGRSIYFQNTGVANYSEEESFARGFNFAKEYSRREVLDRDQIATLHSKAARAAELAKYLDVKNPISGFVDFFKCHQIHHILECM